MIYTITFSPSIDYVINSEKSFDQNGLNRVEEYEFVPGGKGINASVVLKRIGFENQAITFLGGSTKLMFENLLSQENVNLYTIENQADTRINIKMFAPNGHFEINGKRTEISENEKTELFKLVNQFQKDDLVMIMGVVQESILFELMQLLNEKEIPFLLDVDSNKFKEILKYKPLLIKPNLDELERILNKKLNNETDIVAGLKELISLGAKNAMMSNGKKGSYFISQEGEVYKSELQPIDNIVSTVGAGDTLISSFAAFYFSNHNAQEALIKATQLSIGTVQNVWLSSADYLNKNQEKIKVTKIH
ncbi:1-phosphofructokinase family hexose kinase [Mycoplasma sp. Ms02]|uniref:1-phosphofructokinase n=1 Tax=Mycoplasma sp. Ms02 TaxID=353851 RepID=UPI001C8929BB|nr:1-phosphofructokinase family hexose kinase [Mycoplasma sp. Ms02]QZE12119.1 1-phosphofructokinase family hexose kinase [Mycoplasma sp. Ms02]